MPPGLRGAVFSSGGFAVFMLLELEGCFALGGRLRMDDIHRRYVHCLRLKLGLIYK